MNKSLVCIECPKGCVLSVDIESSKAKDVKGAKCPKGVIYAQAEVENPTRVLTSTLLAEGLELRLVPVRTDKPIPKKDLFKAMEEIRKIRIRKPLKAGDTVFRNFLGLGINLIATREVGKRR
ncbi:MAG: DUF1667 domain-containing protein [Candidatus Omnitrophica bacterium]|nr:DUF1667 domain-containing protein [Candidatus Omnitrophota bacterium]MCM8791488.1 DUF1667 domain-containing protein [Candidatus Omnitrophota bacterium]